MHGVFNKSCEEVGGLEKPSELTNKGAGDQDYCCYRKGRKMFRDDAAE